VTVGLRDGLVGGPRWCVDSDNCRTGQHALLRIHHDAGQCAGGDVLRDRELGAPGDEGADERETQQDSVKLAHQFFSRKP